MLYEGTLPSRYLLKPKNIKTQAICKYTVSYFGLDHFVHGAYAVLLPVMTLSWLISSALVRLCLPGTTTMEALIIGACVACTDPVLCNSVVKGCLSVSAIARVTLRADAIAAQSAMSRSTSASCSQQNPACAYPAFSAHVSSIHAHWAPSRNDGFGAPFLWILLLAVLNAYAAKPTALAFVRDTLLWDVLGGSLLGAGIGYAARKALKVARRRDTIDRESMLVFSVVRVAVRLGRTSLLTRAVQALATFSIGLADLLGTNELLACFFAGTALNWTDKVRAEDAHSHFADGVELVFDSVVFLLIGALLPWRTWLDRDFLPPGRLALLGAAVMLLRRMPVVFATYRLAPQIKTVREAAFVGWFVGAAAGSLEPRG
jgi:NhaP-type Na+/H+ or K+/H+ antiporter